MALVKIRELIGTSDKSFEDALSQIVQSEIKKGKNITGARIVSQTVEIKNGQVIEYRVTAKVAYLWKEDK